MREKLLVAAACLTLAVLSFFLYPGHTILQSDTQIYIPIMERLMDPSVLGRDLVAVNAHVRYTAYDEITMALSRLFHIGLEPVLMGQQLVYRALAVLGVFLIGIGAGLSRRRSLILASLLTLGATISGPAVLLVEYEPVPRGFALAFLILSLGLLMNERWSGAAYSAGISFLLHPPTALAFCVLLGLIALWFRMWKPVVILIVSVQILAVLAAMQGGEIESQAFFSALSPELEQLQRMRASYNWVSIWGGRFLPHYALVLAFSGLAYWRMYRHISKRARIFFVALPVIGILSVPVSFVFLELFKWAFIPQFQPGRYLLYLPMFAMLCGGIAGLRAARAGKYAEAFGFLLFPYFLTMDPNVFELAPVHVFMAAGLAAAAAVCSRYPQAFAAACILPFLAIPYAGDVHNYPPLHSAELNQLVEWARTNTDKDALFQFADFGRDLQPGVFRARAKRALYADWKAGGQVNFLPVFADTWRTRWQHVEKPLTLPEYARLGIDYVVFQRPVEGETPVYENGKFFVYSVRRGRGAVTAGIRFSEGSRRANCPLLHASE